MHVQPQEVLLVGQEVAEDDLGLVGLADLQFAVVRGQHALGPRIRLGVAAEKEKEILPKEMGLVILLQFSLFRLFS